jgi:FSR family fosmidomycin resistance protein-like MFS transporter
MSLIGLAPAYGVLAILLLAAGVSSACWHVPAPVIVARAAGRRVGFSMSLLMLGGELSRGLGPLLAVSAVSLWGLEGIWRLVPLGLAASFVLYWRTRHLDVRPALKVSNGSFAETWRELRRVILPIAGIIGTRTFLSVSLSAFLPTLLTREGSDLVEAGGALSLLMIAGALGSLATGTLSDRIGRRRVMLTVLTLAPVLMAVFLGLQGWVMVPVLFLLGFMANSTSPVMLAMVQEHASDHPATGNGLYMALEFVGGSIITVIVGVLADAFGLRAAFAISAAVALCAVPFVLLLPRHRPARP